MAKFGSGAMLGAIGLSVVVLTAGCAGGPAEPTPSDTSSTSTSSPAPTESTTPTPTASGTPLTLGCEQILSLQNVYDFNPNYSQDPAFKVPTPILPLTQIGGVACGWVNQTSGEKFAVGVAKPDEATQATVANQAAAQYQAVPTYGTTGIEGYFGVQSGVGVATVFANGYWIVFVSEAFVEPGDAAHLVEGALSNLQ
ncbi:MAG: iron ABC transporter ATP-binding protein [Agromyces sp.]